MIVERVGASAESCGVDLEDDAVLVQLREDGRDLALAERVVERVVDRLRRDAEARRGVAVDHEPRLQARRSAGRWRRRAAPAAPAAVRRSRGAQTVKLLAVGIFEAVLVLRPADAILDRQVLHRLHVQRDAVDLGQLRLQAADHVAGADLPRFERLQVDLDAAAVQRRVGAVDADERRQALDRRVLAG